MTCRPEIKYSIKTDTYNVSASALSNPLHLPRARFDQAIIQPLGAQFFLYRILPQPLIQAIPEDAKPSEYGAYADILIRRQVDTIFIQPGVDLPELTQYLQSVSVLMIGTENPSKPVSGWVVTLQPNYLESLKAAFPELVAGSGGKAFPAPLSFNNANSTLFGEGKQLYAREVLNELLLGYISTEVK